MRDSLRYLCCGLCGRLFFVCGGCDRGRVYCGEACSKEARRRALRAARLRHQGSPEGRLDHRDHQRDYRDRLRRPPEQLVGKEEICPRADLYGLGVLLYEAITGVRPMGPGPFNA